MNDTCVSSCSKVLSSISGPADWGNHILSLSIVVKFGDLGTWCRPNIHLLGKSYRQEIVITPVNKVQIEIISQLRSVQNLVRNLWNFSSFFLWKNFVFTICYPLERVLFETWHWRAAVKHLDVWPWHCLKVAWSGILVNLKGTTADGNIRTLNYAFLLSHLWCFGCREYTFTQNLVIHFKIK